MFAFHLLLLHAMVTAEDPIPALGAEVVALAKFDLARLEVEDLAKRIVPGVVPKEREADLMDSARAVSSWVKSLKEARARTLLIALDPGDMPGMPLALVPLARDADVERIGRLLTDPSASGPVLWPGYKLGDGVLVAGSPRAIERYATGPKGPRPELAAALTSAGDGPISLAVVPSAAQRRVFEEELPKLPMEMGGASTIPLLRGVRSIGMSLQVQPRTALLFRVRGEDANAIEAARQFGRDMLKYLADQKGSAAEAARDLSRIPAKLDGDSLSMEIGLEQATNLVGMPLAQFQEASGRSNCTNNLKQIALAMHNYHSAHNTFPPAYRADKSGKPLLSWRVLLLPYLEQDELYKQFHLDEPWDSPHNLPLAAKIPPTFECRSSSKAMSGQGKPTTYLTPRITSSIFPGARAIKIQEITDGTSNTILVVDVSDDRAVVWTKPEDWEVGAEPRLPACHSDGTNVGFADGSVRFLKASASPKLLLKLLTRDGGEVISAEEF
ncbi:MAG: DUF1559 domain-containing protein [Isosphaeraceae bacterium]